MKKVRKHNSATKARIAELQKIQATNGGVLYPADVVSFARNPKTALHAAFEWDDTKAAAAHRLEQARQLIRVVVDVEESERSDISVSAYVALRGDRKGEGGYRSVSVLLRTARGRAAILDTAMWELAAFERKYAELQELCEVFAAIRKTRKRMEK